MILHIDHIVLFSQENRWAAEKRLARDSGGISEVKWPH